MIFDPFYYVCVNLKYLLESHRVYSNYSYSYRYLAIVILSSKYKTSFSLILRLLYVDYSLIIK